MKTIEKKYRLPFMLVTVLFLLWGLANNMTDTLLAAFKRIMDISDTQTSLIQFAFYGSYFCFALPAALFLLTPVQGMVSDSYGIYQSYLVPAFCFLVVTAYACYVKRVQKR